MDLIKTRVLFFLLSLGAFSSTASSQFVVGPGEVVSVNRPVDEDIILAGGTLAPVDFATGGPEIIFTGSIDVQNSSAIIRQQNAIVADSRGNPVEVSTAPITIAGPIIGTADLELGNLSRNELVVSGNNTYDGHTFISSGEIKATTPTAFGSTNGGTTVQDGTVRILTETDEQFRIEGGSLIFEAAGFEPNGPITIAGGTVVLPQRDIYNVPVIANAAGGTLHFGFSNSNTSWVGGSSGTGNLTVRGRGNVDAPLTHDGDLTIEGMILNTVNSYTGKTIIVDDYVIDRADVFGTSTTPIEFDDAQVTVNVLPIGDRGFTVRRGTLNVQTTEPIDGNIILGGRFEANIRGTGTFNGSIDYITTPGGGNAHLMEGTFNGPIRGNTPLRMGGESEVILNAANDIQGVVNITQGHVIANDPEALVTPSTHIQGGLVEFNVPVIGLPFMTRYPFGSRQTGTLRLNSDQIVEDLWYLESGTLEAAAAIQFGRLLSYSATITTSGEGQVTIGDELLNLGAGAVANNIVGAGNIRTVGTSLSIAGDLSGFEGDFIVEHGSLGFGRFGSFTEPYQINPASDIHIYSGAAVDFGSQDGVILNNIFLHDTQSFEIQGPLRSSGNGDHVLAGIIDIGNGGATLAEDFEITGTIRGSDLTISHRALRVQSLQNQLAGKLSVRNEGTLWIDQNASFNGLSEIALHGSTLYLDDSPNADRISNSTAIRSRSGRIQLISSRATPTSEVLGTLFLDSGLNEIVASSDHGSQDATLTIDRIVRKAGALLHFDEAGNDTTTKINSVDAFDNTMIGGWAVLDRGFAALDPNGIVVLQQATSNDISSALPTDHVQATGNQTLASDTTIASLHILTTGNPIELDLGGNLLTVVSGGVFFSPEIKNGEITAGSGGPAELILHNTHSVSASIVDHPNGGAVDLVVGNGTTISGSNSYSGSTYVQGDGSSSNRDGGLRVLGSASIPLNNRMIVEGGNLDLLTLSSGVINLSELHLRKNGLVQGSNAPINAGMYYLESGVMNAPITGQGTIYKDSPSDVSFSNVNSPNYTGTVFVRKGTFHPGGGLPNAKFVVEGGALMEGGNFEIVLDGGTFSGIHRGSLQVVSDSELFHNSNTELRGILTGSANLRIEGVRDNRAVQIRGDATQFSGDFHVGSGALSIAASARLGTSTIYVDEGARLTISSEEVPGGRSTVANKIHLQGGALQGSATQGIANGDVFVHGEAFLGANNFATHDGQSVAALLLAGNLVLDNEAHVFGIANRERTQFYSGESRLVEISGTLHVGQDNVWHLGAAALGISGSIMPGATHSSIDFQGVPSSLDLNEATLQSVPGRSLQVTVNGSPQIFSLSAPGAGLSGDGTLVGDFELTDGASVAPGNSPGALTIEGDLELGPSSKYLWEFAGGTGGSGNAWDLLQVNGELHFSASREDPWILAIGDLTGFSPHEANSLLIAVADSISGFDPEAVEVDLTDIADTWPRLTPEHFALSVQGGNLFLQGVPEPGTCLLFGMGLIGLLSQLRIRKIKTI